MPVEISVIMSVYNAEETLGRAIDSILSQTFENFEFLIVDDGSRDHSLQILQEYANKDQRIKVLQHPGGVNRGLTKSLNLAINQAAGCYLARQDSDDVSLADRFEKQFDYMQRHPEIVVLGTNQFSVIEGYEQLERYLPSEQIPKMLLKTNPFAHTSVMIRCKPFVDAGAYDTRFITSQDYEAWMRMSKIGLVAMLEEPLVKRYVHREAISHKRKLRQIRDAFRARKIHFGFLKALGPSLYQFVIAIMPQGLKEWLSARQASL